MKRRFPPVAAAALAGRKRPNLPPPSPVRAFRPVVSAVSALLLSLAFGLAGCSSPSEQAPGRGAGEEGGGPPWFEDVTAAVGLDFVHDAGPVGAYFLPQV